MHKQRPVDTSVSVSRRLSLFLADWRVVKDKQGLKTRLPSLLAAIGSMLRSDLAANSSMSDGTPASLDVSRLAMTLAALAPKLSKARRKGGEINVWHLAGLKRAEVRNAAVLAALWSPGSMGDRATAFLDGFLRLLPSSNELPSRDELAQGYVVRTEHCATGAATERVDITLEGTNFVLAVEVKIDAGEGPKQLARYQQSVENWARMRGKRGAVVLLAPFRTKVPGIVQADWRDIVTAARATLPAMLIDYTHSDRLIDDFARHVAAFQGKKQ